MNLKTQTSEHSFFNFFITLDTVNTTVIVYFFRMFTILFRQFVLTSLNISEKVSLEGVDIGKPVTTSDI